MASGDAFDHTVSHKTDLMRYWTQQRGHGIFITHLRWVENHQRYEVSLKSNTEADCQISRCALIDLFITSFNLRVRIVQMRSRYKQMWEEEDSGDVSNEVDVRRYEELGAWKNEVSFNENHISIKTMADARSDWLSRMYVSESS